MKLFSSSKKSGSTEDKDSSAQMHQAEVDSVEAQRAAQSVPLTDDPQLPPARLMHRLGFPTSNDLRYYFLNTEQPDEDEMSFWVSLSEKAEALLAQMDAAGSGAESFCADACFEVFVARDQMRAFGCLFPPVGNGGGPSIEKCRSSAEKEGVYFGINEALLQEVCAQALYFKIFTFAEGTATVDGTDGQVIELFSREKQINIVTDERAVVDYKNLNWIQKVRAGDVIYQIIAPTAPVDGMNVRGVVKKGWEGKTPKLPIGKNTAFNEDKTALVALVDGQLSFSNGIFRVDQLLQIDQDVDSSTGNLDAIGSINISGNVFDGFTVKATADILVRGSVAGAQLIAGGNIQIMGGVNGSYKGTLTAAGTVSCKYLENCTVSAGGTVKTDSVINSTVTCGDKVIVTAGRGAIIGSAVTCFKGVEARVIGNERNLLTKIIMGSDPKLAEEMRTLRQEIKELSRKSEEYEKNIQYLTKLENLDETHQQLLSKLKLDYSVMKMNITKKSARITVLEEELKDENCQLIAGQIFPPLHVTIGNCTQQFLSGSHMSRIYKHEGEIILGSK